MIRAPVQPRVILLPLDSRPTSYRDPFDLGRIAGLRVHRPPRTLLGLKGRPARCDEILDWLESVFVGSDRVLVHLELPLYGGLIASRIPDVGLAQAQERLNRLARIGCRVSVHVAASLLRQSITVSNSSDIDGWRRLHEAFGSPVDVRERLLAVLARSGLESRIQNFLACRERNHSINQQVLGHVTRGDFASAVFLKEDCSPGGVLAEEEADLKSRSFAARAAGAVEAGSRNRVSFQVGTDEGGMLLVGRAAQDLHGGHGCVRVAWTHPDLPDRILPYEDRPVGQSLAEKAAYLGLNVQSGLSSVGGDHPAPGSARPTLYVHGANHTTVDAAFDAPGPGRLPDPQRLQGLDLGAGLAIADLWNTNGGDPALLRMSGESRRNLLAYAGWNTAGNTLGSVMAQLACSLVPHGSHLAAGLKYTLRRWLEDLVYLSIVRHRIRAHLRKSGLDPLDFRCDSKLAHQILADHRSVFESELASFLGIKDLRGSKVQRIALKRGDVEVVDAGVNARYPWHRDFEIELVVRGRWRDHS